MKIITCSNNEMAVVQSLRAGSTVEAGSRFGCAGTGRGPSSGPARMFANENEMFGIKNKNVGFFEF